MCRGGAGMRTGEAVERHGSVKNVRKDSMASFYPES